jgi:2-phosphosulfolactate phosphatase
MPRLSVHLLPDLVDEAELAGATVVVIDVLRATTTITYALAAGAREVVPCLEIEDARQVARRFQGGEVLLGGERGGVKIEGFDLGNSPEEYSPEAVRGRSIAFTTTNGTRAMLRCRQAKRVLVGAIVNLSAVANAMVRDENIHLVCAGTEGEVSFEDTLVAGWLAHRRWVAEEDLQLNDSAHLANRVFRWLLSLQQASTRNVPERKLQDFETIAVLATGIGGRNVVSLGRAVDLRAAGQIDKFDFVPELNLADWSIRRPSSIA